MDKDVKLLAEAYEAVGKKLVTEENTPPEHEDSWDYGLNLANSKQTAFEAAVQTAFAKHRQVIGDYWTHDYGITEDYAEDFVRDVLKSLNIDV